MTSFLDNITVLVLTYNEEANIGRTLAALGAFARVVVLDSGSTDATLAIAARHPNVRVVHRSFDSHSAQWNFGLARCGIESDWVLALDADYVLPQQLIEEIAALSPGAETTGYEARFRYCLHGRALSGSLYPPVTVLYRRAQARYLQDGHTQRVVVGGDVVQLHAKIDHDDRKSLARWLSSQDRYALLECAALRASPWRTLRWQDRLRRLVIVTPWLVPLYCLIFKHGLIDGRAGFMYALQRGIAEAILSYRLLESSLSNIIKKS